MCVCILLSSGNFAPVKSYADQFIKATLVEAEMKYPGPAYLLRPKAPQKKVSQTPP